MSATVTRAARILAAVTVAAAVSVAPSPAGAATTAPVNHGCPLPCTFTVADGAEIRFEGVGVSSLKIGKVGHHKVHVKAKGDGFDKAKLKLEEGEWTSINRLGLGVLDADGTWARIYAYARG